MNRRSTSVVGWPGWSGRPSARATVTGTTSGSVSGREVDVPDPVGEFGGHREPRPVREACFSGTARAGQRDEAVVGERLADVVHFRLAPNETRQLRRKTLGGNGIGGAQRWKVVVQVGVAELHHAFGAGQIAQRVGAQVGERDTLWELVDDKRFRRAREHRLAAVGKVAEPGGAVDRRSDVVAFIAQLHVAGVQADAQLDRRQWGPL